MAREAEQETRGASLYRKELEGSFAIAGKNPYDYSCTHSFTPEIFIGYLPHARRCTSKCSGIQKQIAGALSSKIWEMASKEPDFYSDLCAIAVLSTRCAEAPGGRMLSVFMLAMCAGFRKILLEMTFELNR